MKKIIAKVLFIYCFTCIYVRGSKVSLEDNQYSNILVAISPDVASQDADKIITSIKASFTIFCFVSCVDKMHFFYCCCSIWNILTFVFFLDVVSRGFACTVPGDPWSSLLRQHPHPDTEYLE